MSTVLPTARHRLPSPLKKRRETKTHPEPTPGSLRLVDRYLVQLHGGKVSRADRTVLKIKVGIAIQLDTKVYQALRVADVVAEAGAAYGSFYRYFTDLEHATVVVLQDLITFSKSIYEAGAKVENPYEAIYQSNLRYIQTYRENAGLMRALLALSEQADEFRAIWDQVVDDWHSRVARRIGSADGDRDLVRANADLTAYALGGMLDQICRQAFAQRNDRVVDLAGSDEHLSTVLSTLWYQAIYAQAPPAKRHV